MSVFEEMSELIDKYCEGEGVAQTPVSAMHLYRATGPSMKVPTIYKPCLCIIASGAKEVTLGEAVFSYAPGKYLVASVDLPIVGCVTNASAALPYRSLSIELDGQMLSDLVTQIDLQIGSTSESDCGLHVDDASDTLLDAVMRLLSLCDQKDDISVMAPMLLREVHYRLLRGLQGARIAQIGMGGSNMQRISKIIRLMKDDFATPLRVDDLAAQANMSPSSFHHHFKQVTSMSPLQYQKRLRLTMARQMMLTEMKDAATAAYEVGYESASQFSREYARMFGAPPMRDVSAILGRLGGDGTAAANAY